jgi:hypothetical protein
MKAILKFLYFFVFFNFFSLNVSAYQIEDSDEYKTLDELARSSGADKSSDYHDYTRVYANYFKDIKDEPITFLEIGIYRGNSVKLWESYFSKADLHFIDINPSWIVYHSSRSHYHFIDQENIEQLQDFATSLNKEFDVILDDGGHTMKQQINSFIALFPFVKSGGLYIIEDLHTSYWREFGGGGSLSNPKTNDESTIAFLKSKIDDLNYPGASTGKANFYNLSKEAVEKLDFWKKNIRSMHFYDSICIIIKR